ncbi:MAG: LuxR C-terminal-related transcriptional regulator [Firmicutes bacterium]|nr:LuxR C-terminal-related transcriptional regulator [Bacillota bacterium]
MRIELRGMEKLSFRERQVVVLKESGKTTQEICKQLGLSAGTVATLYNRARGKGYEVVIILPGETLGIMDDVEEGEGPDVAPKSTSRGSPEK